MSSGFPRVLGKHNDVPADFLPVTLWVKEAPSGPCKCWDGWAAPKGDGPKPQYTFLPGWGELCLEGLMTSTVRTGSWAQPN